MWCGCSLCWRYTCVTSLLFTSLPLWVVLRASWTEVLIKVFWNLEKQSFCRMSQKTSCVLNPWIVSRSRFCFILKFCLRPTLNQSPKQKQILLCDLNSKFRRWGWGLISMLTPIFCFWCYCFAKFNDSKKCAYSRALWLLLAYLNILLKGKACLTGVSSVCEITQSQNMSGLLSECKLAFVRGVVVQS